jgi:hypothetical protein
MEYILGHFVFMSTFFWVGIIIGSLILAAVVWSEEDLIGSATTVFLLFFLPFFPSITVYYGLSLLDWGLLSLIYLLFGSVWSLFKWRLRIGRTRDELTELSQLHDKTSPDATREREKIVEQMRYLKRKVQFEGNKKKISLWIAFWPWQLVSKGAHDIVEFFVNMWKGIYKRMAGSLLSDFEKFGA